MVKRIDINQGDDISHENRSRLFAKGIKTDQRLDLFTATPPFESKKILFSAAVSEGIGLNKEEPCGMKIDFVDMGSASFQAEAVREVFVELPSKDAKPGMCGRLKKSMNGTQAAAKI